MSLRLFGAYNESSSSSSSSSKDDNKGAVLVIALVVVALSLGVITTAMIVRSYAGTYPIAKKSKKFKNQYRDELE